jgi:hypothetical protein
MPKSVELVRLRILRVREGVLMLSKEVEVACSCEGKLSAGGVDEGEDGVLLESSRGR